MSDTAFVMHGPAWHGDFVHSGKGCAYKNEPPIAGRRAYQYFLLVLILARIPLRVLRARTNERLWLLAFSSQAMGFILGQLCAARLRTISPEGSGLARTSQKRRTCAKQFVDAERKRQILDL
eukprot:scaffold27646_cov36-Prasinocladus_malaysianus.AAC.2